MKKAMYEEVKKFEQAYRRTNNEIYGNLESIESDQRRDIWDLFESQNRRYDAGNGEQIESEGLQGDSERNDEYLWTSDKRKSIKLSPDAKKILDSNPELKQVLNIFSHSSDLYLITEPSPDF